MSQFVAPDRRVAVLVGSNRPGRTGPAVADWFLRQAAAHGGLDTELVDLGTCAIPARLTDSGEGADDVAWLREQLAAADGFVIITPEYNHSFPAVLKQAIDLTGPEWQAKPVAFVSYGGMSGGIRAVEQLRQVVPELHAVSIRETVTFHQIHSSLRDDGALLSDAEQDEAAKTLLDQLAWWTEELHAARARHPYGR